MTPSNPGPDPHSHDRAARVAPVENEEASTLPVVELSSGWDAFLQGPARQTLEASVLPAYLHGQRWFGGKARKLEAVRFVDDGPLPGGSPNAVLTLLEVAFADGTRDFYFLPLAVTPGPGAESLLQPSLCSRVLARLKGPAGEALLHDALADNAACATLLGLIADGRELRTRDGQVRSYTTSAYRMLRGPDDGPLPAVRGPETSSNSLVFFGSRLLLKLFRRLEEGVNPDFEIGRFLTEQGTFERTPRVAGTIEYRREGDGPPVTLAILQAHVANQGDGWGHALDELGRYFERVAGRGGGPDPVVPDERSLMDLAAADPPPAARETIGTFLHAAATLGRRTAELHLALARDAGDPAFAPEPLNTDDLAALVREIRTQADRAFAGLRENLDRLPEAIAAEARGLLAEGPGVLEGLARTPPVRPGSVLKVRCHGDYHLGQVLWVENDFVLLDFEGEPTRTVDERRAKQSPLKDVAGMLRSFDYAAHAGLFAHAESHPDDLDRLEPWAVLWQQWTSAAFLRAYLAAAGDAPFLPRDRGPFTALLDAYMLAKAFYELVYELNNRPDWVRIPLRGILALLGDERRLAESDATKGAVP